MHGGDWVDVKKQTRAHPTHKECRKHRRPALQERRAPHSQEQKGDHPPWPEPGNDQVGRDAEDKVGYEYGRPEHALGQGRKIHLLGDVRQQYADYEDDAEGGSYAGGQGADDGPAVESGAFKGVLQSRPHEREVRRMSCVEAILHPTPHTVNKTPSPPASESGIISHEHSSHPGPHRRLPLARLRCEMPKRRISQNRGVEMLARMLGAARLDSHTYEEVERDKKATVQALAVVVLVTIASLIGALFAGEDIDVVRGVVLGATLGIIFWALWALFAYIIGATILKTDQTEADWGQLARCTGFAQTPRLLSVFYFVPVAGGFFVAVGLLWSLAAMVVGVRQALDYTSTCRAFFVALISFIPALVTYGILAFILGGIFGAE